MGIAAAESIRRIPQVRISSIKVNPAILFLFGRGIVLFRRIWSSPLNLLDPDGRFASDHLDRPLLGILCIHLHNRQLRAAGCEAFDDDPHERARSAHSWSIWHAGGRDDGLSAFLIHALHAGDFLRSTRQESALANVLNE